MSRALAVAVLLVLAGCNAPGADPTPAASVTPAPVPDDPTTPTPSGQLAPGVGAEAVNAGRLASAHERTLSRSSYTVNQTQRQTFANGTVRSRYVTVARFAAAPGRFAVTLRQTDRRDGRPVTRSVRRFGDGERTYEAVTENGTTTYGQLRWPDGSLRDPRRVYPGNLTNARSIARLFSLVEMRPVDRSENGTVRLRSRTNVSLPPLSNVSVTAVVSRRGVVRSYRVTYRTVRAGEPVATTVAVSYSRVGTTTVERPGWVSEARNATATDA